MDRIWEAFVRQLTGQPWQHRGYAGRGRPELPYHYVASGARPGYHRTDTAVLRCAGRLARACSAVDSRSVGSRRLA